MTVIPGHGRAGINLYRAEAGSQGEDNHRREEARQNIFTQAALLLQSPGTGDAGMLVYGLHGKIIYMVVCYT